MSSITWKREFMPRKMPVSAGIAAIQWSIRKFEGAKSCSLRKHGVKIVDACLQDGDSSEEFFGPDHCPLCIRFRSSVQFKCDGCPLERARGGVLCYQKGTSKVSPYHAALGLDGAKKNVGPMLRLLREAEKMLCGESRRRRQGD